MLLVESMAQAGVVALGLYLITRTESVEMVEKLVSVFTDAQVDFTGMVKPGDSVRISARKVFFRRRKIRTHSE